jgi:hypothetical protein
MNSSKNVAPKPASSRRKIGRMIILAVCAAFFLTILACCYAVAVVVTAVLNGIGQALGSVLSTVILLYGLVAIYWLTEMIALLATGQLIPFLMRVLQLLGSP